MKSCPHCGYEKNRPGALMCGLCGRVFAEAQARVSSSRPLGRFRKDFAAEIRDNKLGSAALLVGFPLLIAMLGLAFDLWLGSMPWGLFGSLILAVFLMIFTYYEGDKEILGFSGAEPATSDTDPQLINVVDEMRIAAGLPMPRVYVIESDAANALATGRGPRESSVAVTRGLMRMLNREELQGVIGHEMSHVRNLDIRYMMLVSALVGAVVLLADGLRRGMWYGGRIGGRRSSRSSGADAILMLLALVLAILAPLFAVLLQMAISRKREFFG